jgi:hypothetical protein
MVSVKLCVEGGGDRKTLRRNLRRGLGKFIEKAGLQGRMPRIVACGSRNDAYDSFRTALDRGERAMLLVDAEEPVSTSGPWQHLKARDGWNRPGGATDGQCHLMVQVMESWFLADADALESFYGKDFRRQELPANPNIEQVSKRDVLNGLASATRDTTRGPYDKGAHSFDILANLNPAQVRCSSPHANRLILALLG